MPRFAANLSFLFTEVPFAQRFARAARAGFSGVEFLFPYPWPARDIAGWLAASGLEMVLFNFPAGDWDAGERGLACHPARREEFAAGVETALDYARALGCPRLHCLAGLTPTGWDENTLRDTYVANLRHAADRAAGQGVTVLIEAINSRVDMPGYWLDTPAKAFALAEAVGRPNLKVQYDIYHALVMGDDPRRSLREHLPAVGHVQAADVPGRHEPGSGEGGYEEIFPLLDSLGYGGWVGCEYRPRAGTEAGLAYLGI